MSERSELICGRASASYEPPAQNGDGVWGRSPHGDR
ncbi:hypothetical protein BH20ACT4_BH20ACT4_05030 [soil metagenome]